MLKYLVKWGGISNTIIPKMIKGDQNGNGKGGNGNGKGGNGKGGNGKGGNGKQYPNGKGGNGKGGNGMGSSNGGKGDTGPTITGTVPLSVQFNNQSSGEGLTYFWEFGDGGTSNEQSPTHIYHSTGVFPVNLITTNNYGSSTLTGSVTVTNVAG